MIKRGEIFEFGGTVVYVYLGEDFWMCEDGEVVFRPQWIKYVRSYLAAGSYRKL